jgi:hypothetical protein
VRYIPESSIVAIVIGDDNEPMKQLLGTGFVVGQPGSLSVVTARHVVDEVNLASGEQIAIAFRDSVGITFLVNPPTKLPSKHDVAILDASMLEGPIPMLFALGPIPQNIDILSYEYSSTMIERMSSGLTKVSVEPHMHKGNIVLSFKSTFPEGTPTPALLTSFPALKGASGAPVFLSHNGAVIGMLVENYERHLLPAQVEHVTSSKGPVDEIRYFLPMGKALASSVIIKCLNELSTPFEIIEWDAGFPTTFSGKT